MSVDLTEIRDHDWLAASNSPYWSAARQHGLVDGDTLVTIETNEGGIWPLVTRP